MNEYVLSKEDLEKFKAWLGLNIESISWEGRYEEDFHEFWDCLFVPNSSVAFLCERMDLAIKKSKSGPLITWFNWLKQKFQCFIFIKEDLELRELAKLSLTAERSLALTLRDFLLERFPHLEEGLNERLQVGNLTSENLNVKYSDLKKILEISDVEFGSMLEETLTGLEITLYPDWREVFELLKSQEEMKNHQLDKAAGKSAYKKQVRFVRELLLLFLVGGLLILTIKAGNKYYEDYLVKKISLFEPNFFWLDKSLSFKTKNPLAENDVELSYKELENLEQIESRNVFKESVSRTRFEVESDVALTSVDSLPKDFTVADLEQSDYEEVRKGGYRNSRYGRRLAYRVMMTSVNPNETKAELLKVLDGFEVKQADNVRPGTKIPGGLYFNLYVPGKNLKEFLSRVSKVEESTILESKTVFGGPYGTNKVFIWIKSI